MLTTILIVVAVLVIGVLLVAATRPADVRVSRTATLAAPPRMVFPHLNDLRKFQDWSPWAKLDPNCRLTFETKVMCLFMSMDKAIGGQFDQGLARLDAASRAGASVA
jgi:hypothetical protein